jgi:signal transduction histidine kinase/ligand-binding sensor domain-containing protein
LSPSKLLIAVLLLTIILWPAGLDAANRIEPGRPFVDNYLPAVYQAHPQNWAIQQDERGIVYFANSTGILEYDGVSWRLIPGPNRSVVRSLALDDRNRIYVGGNADFGYLSPDSIGQMQFVSMLNLVDEPDRQFGNIWSTFVTESGVYFQGYNHILRYKDALQDQTNPPADREKLQVWYSSGRFLFSELVRGELFVHQSGVGLMKMSDDRLQLVADGGRFAQLRIDALLPFGTDEILVVSRDVGLMVYDGKRMRPFASPANEFLIKNQVISGLRSPDGNYAFTTMRGGVIVMNENGDIVQILDKAAGLMDNFVREIYFDRHGAMWLALDSGIARAETPSPLSLFDEKAGLESYVVSIIRHNDILYVATGLGVYYLDTNTRQFSLVSGITARSWWLLSAQDQLLVATDDGLYGIDGQRGYEIKKFEDESLYAYSLHHSERNSERIYVGLLDGLAAFSLRNGSWRQDWRINGLNESVRNFVETDDGFLWMGTHSTSVLRANISDPTTGGIPKIERFGPEHNLPQGGISVYRVKGEIYFVSRGQIFRFDGRAFVEDSTFAGIGMAGSQEEYSLKEDRRGNVWINFGAETAVASRTENGDYSIQKRPFLEISHLPNYFIYPDDDGVVWFGSEEVLIRYDPEIKKDYNLDYPALIRSVVVDEDSLIFGGGYVAEQANTILTHGHNAVNVTYSASSFEAVIDNRYQTYLEGFDKGWSSWSSETRRNYTNLPAGDYVFRVQARNIYQHLSSEASFAFTIKAPWYQSWLAWLVYFMLACGLIFTIIRLRTNQLEQRSRELELIVEERTTEIQQRLEELAVINSVQNGLVRELDIQAIYDLVGDQIRDIFDAQVVLIATFDHENELESFNYAFEKGQRIYADTRPIDNLRRRLIETRQNIDEQENVVEKMSRHGSKVLPGTEVPKSVLFVPLVVGKTVRGYVSLQNIDREHAFSESDIRLLTTLGNSMSVALENARLFDETSHLLAESKQRASELATVNNISQALTAQLEFDALVKLVGEQIRTTFNADIAYVALLDKSRDMLTFPYGYGDDLPTMEFGEGLTSQIIKQAQPILINEDIQASHEELGIAEVGIRAASYLGVPIKSGPDVIGVMSVQSTQQEGRFDEDDMRLLTTIAANVGIALQNAESYRQLNSTVAQLNITLDNLKATQDQLITQEKLASLGALTAGIAHEIKNPLNIVNNFAELSLELVSELRQDLGKYADAMQSDDHENIETALQDLEQNSRKINEHGKRADSIVRSMLQHSRGKAGEHQLTDINAMLEEDLNLAYHGMRAQDSNFNIRMEKSFDPDIPAIEIVPQDISRVFLNIITNGFYEAHRKSAETGAGSGNALLRIVTENGDGVITIRIRDNGNGIPEDIRDKLFNPFFTTKPTGQGTGLGLSISYDIIVHQHRGEIYFETETGQFTEFIIRLPKS